MEKARDDSRLDEARSLGIELGPHLLERPHVLARDASHLAVVLPDEGEAVDDSGEDEIDEEVCEEERASSRADAADASGRRTHREDVPGDEQDVGPAGRPAVGEQVAGRAGVRAVSGVTRRGRKLNSLGAPRPVDRVVVHEGVPTLAVRAAASARNNGRIPRRRAHPVD